MAWSSDMAWFIAFLLLFSMEGWLTRAVEYKLDGSTYIIYSTSAKSFSKTPLKIHMLFRTAEDSGILLHARGTNGDFITLEIVRGKLRYASVFGRGSARTGSHDVIIGDDIGDDQWHQIDIERDKNILAIKLDITKKYLPATGAQKYQNINHDITVAGLPSYTTENPGNHSVPRISLAGSTFIGCMEDVTFNKVNIFKATKEKSKDVSVLGVLRPKCTDDKEYYPPATLTKSTSFIKLDIANGRGFDLRFKFRTFDHSGMIVHYVFGSTSIGRLSLELIHGKLSFSFQNLNIKTIISPNYLTYANGLWHKVLFNLTSKGVAIQVNNERREKSLNGSGIRDLLQNPRLRIGGNLFGKSSMRGCVKELQLNGTDVKITSTMSQDVDLSQCYLNDLCFSNPCLHNGECTQHNNTLQCDCTNTGYHGARCENISASYNTTSTRHPSSHINTKSSSTPAVTIRPSRATTERTKIVSGSFTPYSSWSIAAQNLPSPLVLFTKLKTAHPAQSTTPQLKQPTTEQSHTPMSTQTSSAQPKQPISSMTTQISKASKTKAISPSTTFPHQSTHSVLRTLPTAQKPTHQINTQIIIIEKTNTITNVGFNKNQLLVYLFLFIVFILFVGLIVIISVKLSYFPACSCMRRFQAVNSSLPSQDSIELGQQDTNDATREINHRRVKSARPSSVNDSGIDRSESGTDSHRSSAEMHDRALQEDSADLETGIEDDPSEGFLVLQEDPSLYTQHSFGWTVLDSSSTIQHCRTSTRDLIHAANENKPRAFRPAYYRKSELSDDVVAEDDVTESSETRFRNPTTKYRQLTTSNCSSVDNVSIELEECSSQDLEENHHQDCVGTRDDCPVF